MAILDSLICEGLLKSELAPLKEIYLAIRSDSAPGDGTKENPFDASTALLFDEIIALHAGLNVTVRLGPGLFRTQGGDGAFAENPLILFSRMKFVGAGMFNTTLRLAAAESDGSTDGRFFAVISANPVKGVEISDLTIDCDLANQPVTPGLEYSKLSNCAIGMLGESNRIYRVRVMNFGTRTPFSVNGVSDPKAHEAFILQNIGENCVTEDCVLEKPFFGSARETTISTVTGPNSVLRNNFYDLAFVNQDNGFPTRITSLKSDGGTPATITVRTFYPHNMKAGDYVEIKGADVGSSFNDRFLVTYPAVTDPISRELRFQKITPGSIPTTQLTVEQSFQPTTRVSATWVSGTPSTLTITTPVRHFRKVGDWVALAGADLVNGNTQDVFNGTYQVLSDGLGDLQFKVACVGFSPAQPSGEMWLDRRLPRIRFQKVDSDSELFFLMWGSNTLDAFAFTDNLATFTTYGPHYFKPGEYFSRDFGGPKSILSNYLKVESVPDRTSFSVWVPSDADLPLPTFVIYVQFNFNYQACSVNGYLGSTMERNRILHAHVAGDYHDTWHRQDAIIRKNYYYDIYHGIRHLLGGDEGYGINDEWRKGTVSSVGSTEITLESTTDPNPYGYIFEIGLIIRVYKINPLNTNDMTVSRVTTITGTVQTIPGSPVKYQFKVKKVDGTFSTNDGVRYFLVTSQNQLTIEDNIIDLANIPLPVNKSVQTPPLGVSSGEGAGVGFFGGPGSNYPDLFLNGTVVVRRNLFRPKNGTKDPQADFFNSVSVQVYSCKHLFVEHNISTNLPPAAPGILLMFTTARSLNVQSFNNQFSSDSTPLHQQRLYYFIPNDPGLYLPELYDEADDWLIGF